MDEVLFDSKFLSVKKTPRGFFYAERLGKDSLSILPYYLKGTSWNQIDNVHILLRLQPRHFEGSTQHKVYISPITGSIDSDEIAGNHEVGVIAEIEEEAGVSREFIDDVIQSISTKATTQSNENVHGYLAELAVTDYRLFNGEGDGSVWDKESYTISLPLSVVLHNLYKPEHLVKIIEVNYPSLTGKVVAETLSTLHPLVNHLASLFG